MKTNFEIASTSTAALTQYDKELDEELDRACERLELMAVALENRIHKQKSTFVICAQMGNQEDWGWEEVNRTTDLDEALSAARTGARVYVNHSEHRWNTIITSSFVPIDEDELPF